MKFQPRGIPSCGKVGLICFDLIVLFPGSMGKFVHGGAGWTLSSA